MTIGQALQARLDELTVSQREAAERLDVTQQTISRWISGDLLPAEAGLSDLARFLGIPIAQVRTMYAAERRARRVSRRTVNERLDGLERDVRAMRSEIRALTRLLGGDA